jgi:hypothetical protein
MSTLWRTLAVLEPPTHGSGHSIATRRAARSDTRQQGFLSRFAARVGIGQVPAEKPSRPPPHPRILEGPAGSELARDGALHANLPGRCWQHWEHFIGHIKEFGAGRGPGPCQALTGALKT